MKRLTEAHPLYKKLEKLFDFMADEGIQIESNGYLVVHAGGVSATIMDLEADPASLCEGVGELPPALEWKLIKQ